MFSAYSNNALVLTELESPLAKNKNYVPLADYLTHSAQARFGKALNRVVRQQHKTKSKIKTNSKQTKPEHHNQKQNTTNNTKIHHIKQQQITSNT